MSRATRSWINRAAVSIVLGAVVPAIGHLQPAAAERNVTELVSISTDGQQGNDISGRFAAPAINGNGQIVAFDSIATTLVPNDTNKEADVFVRDRSTNTTERVSVSSTGRQANEFSSRPALDSTGDLVAFDSFASNLVGGDTNGLLDVFVHQRSTHETTRVSVSSDEVQGNASSNSPSISADGRFVAFVSTASNLVPGDTNGVEDIFVRDLVAGTTERVSLTSTGQQANSSTTSVSISVDGRWVAFSSFASNLVPGDDNGNFDVFVHDRQTGQTELVSVSSAEVQGNGLSTTPSVSGDGQLVAFWSDATNLVRRDTNERRDVFVRNRAAGTTERVSVSSEEEQANGNSQDPAVRGFTASGPDITPDGRFVAFFSSATNLVAGDTNTCPPVFDGEPGRCPDVFVRDRLAGTTERVNLSSDGAQANERSSDPAISHNGRVVAFFSAAGNLVRRDNNVCPGFFAFPGNCPDIFVHDGGPPLSGDADLSVTQTDSKDPISVRDRLAYGITVANGGPAPATRVTLTDDLPDGVRFLSATSKAGSCALHGGDVICSLGGIGPETAVDVRITVETLEPGTIQNAVTVAGDENDPFPENNQDVETTLVVRGSS